MREGAACCEPEDLNVAQRDGAGKSERKNKEQELLELRAKGPKRVLRLPFPSSH